MQLLTCAFLALSASYNSLNGSMYNVTQNENTPLIAWRKELVLK